MNENETNSEVALLILDMYQWNSKDAQISYESSNNNTISNFLAVHLNWFLIGKLKASNEWKRNQQWSRFVHQKHT